MSNLFWCIAGIVGGALFSLIIGALFYFVGIKRKKISYDIKTFPLISNKINKIEGLTVKYHSQEIDDLFSSTITIKNTGNSKIESQDFAPLYPLALSTTGKFLIDKTKGVQLISSKKSNNIHLLYDLDDRNMCDCITIAYDYISKKDEATLSLIHTGEISVSGELKEGQILSATGVQKQNRIVGLFLNIITTFLGITFAIVAFIIFLSGTGATR